MMKTMVVMRVMMTTTTMMMMMVVVHSDIDDGDNEDVALNMSSARHNISDQSKHPNEVH